MSENKNTEIWDGAFNTPISLIKQGNNGLFKFKSVPSLYYSKVLTEIFGAAGSGWGIDVVSDDIVDAAPVFSDGNIIGTEKVHKLHINLWYKLGGEKQSIPGYGLTKFIYYSAKKTAFITDYEYQKKSLSDAIKTAAKHLGIAGDIFMGMYDDNEYIAEMREQDNSENVDKYNDKIIKATDELREWTESQKARISEAANVASLKVLHNMAIQAIQSKIGRSGVDPNTVRRTIDFAMAKRQAELVGTVCEKCGTESSKGLSEECESCGGKLINK